MLTINNVKFARDASEFTDTLFQSGGTAYGFYKPLKDKIIFMDHQYKPFAALVKNKEGYFLVNCTKINKHYHYQFALSSINEKLFGVPETYIDSMEYVEQLGKEYIN